MKKTIFLAAIIIGVSASSVSAMTMADVVQLNSALKQEAASNPAVLGASMPGTTPGTAPVLPEKGPVRIKQALRYANGGSPAIINVTLKPGMSGSEKVKALQAYLNAQGYDLPITGFFGPLTKKAVVDFQKTHGLGTDGVVGPKTQATITADVAANTTQ